MFTAKAKLFVTSRTTACLPGAIGGCAQDIRVGADGSRTEHRGGKYAAPSSARGGPPLSAVDSTLASRSGARLRVTENSLGTRDAVRKACLQRHKLMRREALLEFYLWALVLGAKYFALQ